MSSFDDFKGILPYASEVFGIYQPLLGWKSRRIAKRYERFRVSLYNELASRALVNARAPVEVKVHDAPSNLAASRATGPAFTVSKLVPLDLDLASAPRLSTTIDSGVARLIATDLGSKPHPDWTRVITTQRMGELLKTFQEIVSSGELSKHPQLSDYVDNFSKAFARADTQSLLQELFARESKVAGYLLFLAKHTPSSLEPLFFSNPTTALLASATMADPLLNFGSNSYQAILSPIGIIHLYREYFFEFNSFLGPPVGHVWLSPGGTVELIEISTRRTLTERSVEQSLETITKSETDVTTQDDIADAVKEENRDNIKFGFTTTGSYSSPVSSATATADLSLDKTKEASRETTHKQMRQQSEKLFRGKTSSFPNVDARQNIMSLAEACLPELGLVTLQDADRLPKPVPGPRDESAPPGSEEPRTPRTQVLMERLGQRILTLLKRIPLSESSGNIEGVFACYRLLPNSRVVKSQMVIFRRGDFPWLEFIEQWSRRPGEVIEYCGCVVPDSHDFFYFLGANRKYGYPKMMVGRRLDAPRGKVALTAISTAPAPAQSGVISGNLYMERLCSLPKRLAGIRRVIALGETGDANLDDLDNNVIRGLTAEDFVPGFASVMRPETVAG